MSARAHTPHRAGGEVGGGGQGKLRSFGRHCRSQAESAPDTVWEVRRAWFRRWRNLTSLLERKTVCFFTKQHPTEEAENAAPPEGGEGRDHRAKAATPSKKETKQHHAKREEKRNITRRRDNEGRNQGATYLFFSISCCFFLYNFCSFFSFFHVCDFC